MIGEPIVETNINPANMYAGIKDALNKGIAKLKMLKTKYLNGKPNIIPVLNIGLAFPIRIIAIE
jgi:hypothetical protein